MLPNASPSGQLEPFMNQAPAAAVEAIARASLYHSYYDFQLALNDWECTFGHRMRVGSSEILKNAHGVRDEVFKYRVLVLQCIHYGQPRDRGSKKKHPNRLACGCNVMLRLNFSVKEQLLRVTSLIDIHTGHALQPGKQTKGVRRRISDQLEPLKRARLSLGTPETADCSLVASPAALSDSTKTVDFGIKPRLSYPMIAALAIYNSPKGALLNKEIYIFFQTYFLYYRTAYGSWKNSVRHALHTHDYFSKALGQNDDKENMVFSVKEMDKFLEDLAQFQKKYPKYEQNVFGLAYPEHWEPMTRGDLKDPKIGMVRPVAKRTARKIKMEDIAEDEEYTPQGGRKISDQFSHRTPRGLRSTVKTEDMGYSTPVGYLHQQIKTEPMTYPGVELVKPMVLRPGQQLHQPPLQQEMSGFDALLAASRMTAIEHNDITLL